MNFWTVALLIGAGFLGGVANSMAGGASLFTFPALIASGLSPITANASNAFALLPGNSLGVLADREKLPQRDSVFWIGTVMSFAGCILGALLLLYTTERIFAILVPALIGAATAIFAFSRPIQAFVNWLIDGDDHPKLRSLLVFLAAIYCGYFGAGVGVIFMAVLGATTPWDLRTTNAYKNFIAFLGNIAASAVFALQGMISWPSALTMMFGTALGGLTGAWLVRVLPSRIVRAVIITSGIIMTSTYVYRYWA